MPGLEPGEEPPQEFSRPEVAKILMEYCQSTLAERRSAACSRGRGSTPAAPFFLIPPAPALLLSSITMCSVLSIVHATGETALRTNIVIDDKPMVAAMRASGLRTKRAAVEEGLRLLVSVRRQAGIRKLKGRVNWESDLDAPRLGRVDPQA